MKYFSSLAARALCAIGIFSAASAAHATVVGCPWMKAYSSNGKGAVDSNAAYWSSLMPNNVAAGTTVQIYGTYPQLRFFNFTIYHNGALIDHLADSDLVPEEGGPANPSVAAIPYSNNYTDHYRITIKYQDVPVVREPNTLYAGSDTSLARLLIMRNYLPNSGVSVTGGVGLPTETQINPDGSSQRYDTTSSNLACPVLETLDSFVFWFTLPTPGIASKNPQYAIVPMSQYSSINLFPAYANSDAGYGYLTVAPQFGDMVVTRAKLPATPGRVSDPASLQTRYFSICEYQSTNRLVLGCLDDQQLTVQDDGYFTLVTSTAAKRPALANPANGYNWLPFPNTVNKTLYIIREVLPNADFTGNYQTASGASDPLAALGEWAPLATYCDSATFNANAASGGAKLFAACQASSKKVSH